MMTVIGLPKKKQSMRMLNMITVIFILGSLFGCATGSTVITGTKRSEISPNEVKIYLDPPPKYESIGIIEVSSLVVAGLANPDFLVEIDATAFIPEK